MGLVDTKDVLPDRQRRHAVCTASDRSAFHAGSAGGLTGVVGDTAEVLGRLAGGERLPPRCLPGTSVQRRPVHEVGRVLIRAEEQDLGILAARNVDNGTLDAGRLARNEQVDNGLCLVQQCPRFRCSCTDVDVFLEALLVVGVNHGQDRSLGATLGDILVLEVLRSGEGVVLVEQRSHVGVVVPELCQLCWIDAVTRLTPCRASG